MEFFWFWVIIFLLLTTIFTWPAWPYTRNFWTYRNGTKWSYSFPLSAVALLITILLLSWFGLVLISTPAY